MKTINTHCHGCKNAMSFEAVPVKITELTGDVSVYEGKEDAVWICGVCRQEPSKLKAARLAAGMPAKPESSRFDDDDVQEVA
jgi:hypothetical protein